ncbi:MAG TPA: MerR family transcriptional regulator [Flavipsychrobacter sp.]|nr:MerR family transcriptional regulator [Flavipsychrobacter sp.]
MNVRVLTLFDEEEFLPEPIKASAKTHTRGKKPKKEAAVEKEVSSKKTRTIPSLDNWQPEKQYYSIGEVADIFQLSTSNVRFWTTEFHLKVRTTKKGDRLYTPEQVYELRSIYVLVKEKGFTLSGARQKLKDDRRSVNETTNLKQTLLNLRNMLVEVQNRI